MPCVSFSLIRPGSLHWLANMFVAALTFISIGCSLASTAETDEISVSFDASHRTLNWGIERLDASIAHAGARSTHLGVNTDADIRVAINSESAVDDEGFIISVTDGNVTINAKNAVGAMYGMLEVGEQLEMAGSLAGVKAKTVNARFPFRAIKFNLPWSSYRRGEALQLHTETVRDLDYWAEFLDMMAENRFNALTLWNQHPWPYLIKPTNFPLASPWSDAEMQEWRTFWTELFRMAQDRGIKPYLVNWNVFVNEAFRIHYEPTATSDEQHWAEGSILKRVKRYNRECVTQVINEYPDLAGLGTAHGDAMQALGGPQEQADWIKDVYYGGIKDANREVEFIHRAAFRGENADIITRETIESADLDTPIWTELKFNWSHGLSTPKLVQIHGEGGAFGADNYLKPEPTKYKVTWMIRNEDIFVLRWGNADFIREHIAQNGQPYVGGYFFGSETYIPAVDYIHQPDHAHVDWEYEFERKWLTYKEWGRLLYDPTTPDAVFQHAFNKKFGISSGEALFAAWEAASIAPLRFAQIAPSTWDFTLYQEGFMAGLDTSTQPFKPLFFSLDDMIAAEPFDDAYIGIQQWVDAGSPEKHEKITPIELAEELEANSEKVFNLIRDLPDAPPSLQCEKYDIEAWGHYGLYFAKKIRGAVAKAQNQSDVSKKCMKEALGHWEELIRINKLHNRESIPDMAAGQFSWNMWLDTVRQEAQ